MQKTLFLIGCSAVFLSSVATAQQTPPNQQNSNVQQFEEQFKNHKLGLTSDTTSGLGIKPARGYGPLTNGYKGNVSGVGVAPLGSIAPVKKCAAPLYATDKQCVD